MPNKQQITNWGLYPLIETSMDTGREVADFKAAVSDHAQLIPRGNGRCYGDSSLNDNFILSSQKLDKILAFNTETGIITCQSGVIFSDLLKVIVPKGFFFPVTPGTKFISVGGAIASDVHGKSHSSEGNFSRHLISFNLLLADGNIITCSKETNAEVFWASCGGMGLTGMILQATFQLLPVETSYIDQLSIKAKNLYEVMDLFQEYKHYPYSVAWIDCLAKGNSLGRSILNIGEQATLSKLSDQQAKEVLKVHDDPSLSIPFHFPPFVLNTVSIKAFNFLFYNKQFSKIQPGVVHYEPFYYPLDKIYHWNRMYGKNGFTQYQMVLPLETSKEGLTEILNTINRSGEGSFLAVLKLFGKADEREYLSFPMEGFTLALDFKINKRVFALLDELDKLVLKYGGRVYLTKDVRMTQEVFEQSYPRHTAFKEVLKTLNSSGKFASLQSERIGLS